MEDVTSIINRQHQEMFQKLSGPVYLAAFFLDVRFQSSDVFLGYKQSFTHAHKSQIDLSSDSDLRRLLPAYTLSGGYLIKLLGLLYNKNPNAPPFLHYSSWLDVKTPFYHQLISFTRGASPFDKRYDDTQSARQYWENLISVPSADLLALVGLLLSSIVPNSMAEERTMSTITKLNSPDRAAQKVGTLIDMTTIRQYYKREEALKSPSSHSLRPTVRFADLTAAAQILTPKYDAMQCKGAAYDEFTETSNEPVPTGSQSYFEVEREDGVFLASKVLFDTLSD
ncbi:unnamed protein product, partial [Rhizoctonia solani]